MFITEERVGESNESLVLGSEAEVHSSSAAAVFYHKNFPSLSYCSLIISYYRRIMIRLKKHEGMFPCINSAPHMSQKNYEVQK